MNSQNKWQNQQTFTGNLETWKDNPSHEGRH